MKMRSKFLLVSGTVCLLFFLSFFSILYLVQNFPVSDQLPENGIIVVFGAGIYNTRPSLTLQMRLDKALEIAQKISNTLFYLSGTKSEVIIMRQYLIKQGISRNKLIEDPEGKTTAYTIRNLSRSYKNETLILVSQHYHLRRIALLCRKHHLLNAFFVATDHRSVDNQFSLVLREVFAMYKAFLWD
ncbi:YdcF family protein [Thermospira aquatica]|uniref:YdcF family protein n=1 Tax=Thermospira aquatica TaxID=2828656 RepID=A0AAX3BCK3_9SPIR|nr:YdcF family protein [Thermospira aquatica]URA09919.1 YdcF family protein [Thermospira aquatica]